jgi:hypothetical protein
MRSHRVALENLAGAGGVNDHVAGASQAFDASPILEHCGLGMKEVQAKRSRDQANGLVKCSCQIAG